MTDVAKLSRPAQRIQAPWAKPHAASGSSHAGVPALFCGALAVAIVGVYNGIWFNRYAPLPEGWFSVYADLMRKGEMPYRDFYFFLPPAYPLFIAAVQAVLGPKIIMLRIVGVLVILTCTGALFEIFRRCFGAIAALFISVVTMVYYQSGNAHIAYDFIQVMNMLTLLACLFLMRFECLCRAKRGAGMANGWALAAGAFAAGALFTKHSNGLFISCACAAAACLAGRGSLRGLGWFLAGGGLVGAALGLWLVATGSLAPGASMMLGGAAASKGGLATVFFGFLPELFKGDLFSRWLAIFILFLPLGLTPIWLLRFASRSKSPLFSRKWGFTAALTLASLLLAALLVPWKSAAGIPAWIPELCQNYITLAMVPAAILGTSLILLAWFAGRHTGQDPMVQTLMVPALVALGMLWGNGTSGGLSESGAFLGFGLFLGLVITCGGFYRLGAVAAGVAMLLQTSIYAEVKYRCPYFWWGVQEADIRSLLVPATQPLQSGLWVAPEEGAIFDRVTAIIKAETLPGQRILVFPQTPIFYLLADRPIMGRAVVHWFDFLPDNLARDEAALLLEHPPSLIVMMDMPDEVWLAHEQLFRDGRPCGQREIVANIRQLQNAGVYREIATVPIGPGYHYEILKRQ